MLFMYALVVPRVLGVGALHQRQYVLFKGLSEHMVGRNSDHLPFFIGDVFCQLGVLIGCLGQIFATSAVMCQPGLDLSCGAT